MKHTQADSVSQIIAKTEALLEALKDLEAEATERRLLLTVKKMEGERRGQTA
jgi:hypothetical protein